MRHATDDPGEPLSLGAKIRLVLFTPFYILLGLLLLSSTPLLALLAACSHGAQSLVYRIILNTVVPLLRYFLDTIPTWLVHAWWLRSHAIAQDGLPVMHDVAVGGRHNYGAHPRENLSALFPCHTSLRSPKHPLPSDAPPFKKSPDLRASLLRKNAPPPSASSPSADRIPPSPSPSASHSASHSSPASPFSPTSSAPKYMLYVHGGGWIAANATCLTPSTTAFARAGYETWMMNYPLSPESRFPTALRSIFKAMTWLYHERGIRKLVLAGDSAGGNLATMAAACLHHPRLMAEIFPENIPVFPRLIGVVSLYGILDRSSWEAATATISYLENVLSRFALRMLFYAYTRNLNFAKPLPQEQQPLDGCITLCDVLPAIKEYPPTLLVAGTRDVLIHSSRRAFAELRAKGCQVSMMEYDARHAFFGLPPGLNSQPGAYLNHAAPALEQILNFLDDMP